MSLLPLSRDSFHTKEPHPYDTSPLMDDYIEGFLARQLALEAKPHQGRFKEGRTNALIKHLATWCLLTRLESEDQTAYAILLGRSARSYLGKMQPIPRSYSVMRLVSPLVSTPSYAEPVSIQWKKMVNALIPEAPLDEPVTGSVPDGLLLNPLFVHMSRFGSPGQSHSHCIYACFIECNNSYLGYVGRTVSLYDRFFSNDANRQPYLSHCGSMLLTSKYKMAHLFSDTVFSVLDKPVYVCVLEPSAWLTDEVTLAFFQHSLGKKPEEAAEIITQLAGSSVSIESGNIRVKKSLHEVSRVKSLVLTILEYYHMIMFRGQCQLNERFEPCSFSKTISVRQSDSKELIYRQLVTTFVETETLKFIIENSAPQNVDLNSYKKTHHASYK